MQDARNHLMASSSDVSRPRSKSSQNARLSVREALELSPEEQERLGSVLTDNFAHFARFPSKKTELFFAKVYRDEVFLGFSPVIKLVKSKSTNLLKPKWRKWLGPTIGLFARKTTYLVDTAFMTYDLASPFYCVDPVDKPVVRQAVSDYLKSKRDAQTVWMMLLEEDLIWARENRYNSVYVLPMVRVEVAGHDTLESYIGSLDRQRRRNYRRERKAWNCGNATTEWVEGPLNEEQAAGIHRCLIESASRSAFHVPYNDVLTNPTAVAQQAHATLIARENGRTIGFMSFLHYDKSVTGDKSLTSKSLMQCHGGFDCVRSLELKAYHNLIYDSIEYAIRGGFDRLSMGPCTNETKRRAGTHFHPVAAGLWCHRPDETLFTRLLFLKNFQVYTGEIDWDSLETATSTA